MTKKEDELKPCFSWTEREIEAEECALGRFSCQGSKSGCGCTCDDVVRAMLRRSPTEPGEAARAVIEAAEFHLAELDRIAPPTFILAPGRKALATAVARYRAARDK